VILAKEEASDWFLDNLGGLCKRKKKSLGGGGVQGQTWLGKGGELGM